VFAEYGGLSVAKLQLILVVTVAVMFFPNSAGAQQADSGAEGVVAAADQSQQDPPNQLAQAQPQPNAPPATQRVEAEARRTARRFSLGVQGGAGLDPELVDVGVHAMFGPIFTDALTFRPVFEIGAGELTTLLGINLDVLYTFPGFSSNTRWMPYVGAGPQFGLSHQGFETDDLSNVNIDGVTLVDNRTSDRSRFDFGDTDFNSGMNFIVGMKRQSGAFFEMKATAWGVSSIRLLAGFNFYGRGGQSPQ
jgi:hypothetical protein